MKKILVFLLAFLLQTSICDAQFRFREGRKIGNFYDLDIKNLISLEDPDSGTSKVYLGATTDTSSSYTLYLPPDLGSSGECLKRSGAEGTDWGTCGSGGGSGSNQPIFFEHDGSAEADSQTSGVTVDTTTGLDLTCSGQDCTLSAEDASDTNKGVATFNTDNFAVSSGDVTIKDGGVDLSAEVTGTLPVANGGTGATTLTDGGILLGSGTAAITAMSVLGDGAIVVGDGTTDPVALTAFTSSTGTLKHESGGLEADVNAYDGLIGITGGTTFNQTGTSTQIIIFDGSGAPTSASLAGHATMDSSGNLGLNAEAIRSQTEVTAVAGDYVLIRDATDGTLKKSNASDFLSSGGGNTNLSLPVYSAKITGAFVTHTPAGCSTTASTQGAAIDAGNGNWRLLFDASTDEAAVWQFVMPANYSSTPSLDVHFSMASGEANEVEFEAAIMCSTPNADTADVGTASFANCATGTATTVSATAGEPYSQVITLNDDSCSAGDDVWIWLSTDADDATFDDATGDREVINVELQYTGS